MVIGTVSQIEVNQGLIGDTFGVSQRLEVVDGAAVDVDVITLKLTLRKNR